MIRKFSVKNYKNFKEELCIDFTNVRDYKYNELCVKNNLISKVIIYGKNAVGKSNLGQALYDIVNTTIRAVMQNEKKLFKNADSDNNDLVEFNYSFLIDEDIIDYSYSKESVNKIGGESLYVNGKLIFKYNLKNDIFNFDNTIDINSSDLKWDEFINAVKNDDADEENYLSDISALRYIMFNTIQNEDSIIFKLKKFIMGMRFSDSTLSNRMIPISYVDELLEENSLRKFEKFLNDYGVECKLKIMKNPIDGQKDIYFDYARPLSFSRNLSSGTSALTSFYINYLFKNKPSFIFIDEFDAFYHFELSEKIVDLLEKEFECQVVLTSHNTNLLSNSIMRPDCFMILSKGKLTPICDATTRELRQGHNLEKLYINGEFDE